MQSFGALGLLPTSTRKRLSFLSCRKQVLFLYGLDSMPLAPAMRAHCRPLIALRTDETRAPKNSHKPFCRRMQSFP